MFRACVGASRGLRWGVLALSAAVLVVAIGSDPADARSRRRGKQTYTKHSSYSPPYAAIVVDANSGRVLHAANPDSQRHPASVTKVMTLYLLFEQLEAGRLRLDSQLPVSAHAASMAPSKLNLRPGQTIAVEDAIKALVTKSANDVAVVVAEAIGGDEDSFAEMMTRKARALGMSRTVYANASGLPNDEQVTTARDQSLLGRAIQDRFPRQYRYFATSSFFYRGHAIRNHNRLLAASPASTASRPASSGNPASISSPRCGAAIATSSRWCSAERRAARATRACATSSKRISGKVRPNGRSRRSPRVRRRWRKPSR